MSKSILDTAEVIHDYMRNGDRSTSREECITWIAQLIQEASQQAPSADTCTEDKHIKGCKCEAPSATVDKKWYTKVQMYEYLLGKNYDKSIAEELAEDYANNLEKAYHKGRLRSQQPTVDDPYMKNFGVSSQQPTVDVDSLWRKHSVHIDNENQLMKYHHFEKALTEALRGSYSRESLRLLIQRARMISKVNGVDTLLFTEDYLLTQYDTERGKSNG